MSYSFTAIDFETAQGKRWSICQVGLVRFENGKLITKLNELVQPPDNFYHPKNISIHGIHSSHTRSAPSFAKIWPKLKPFIQGQTVVAHNGAFDFSCLSQALELYRLTQPPYEQKCTYKIYGKDLHSLCIEHGIKLDHHNALSDAMACAELYKRHLGFK